MDLKISENFLYELVEMLVEPKSLRPANNECVLHLCKRNRILDQLLVLRRNALSRKQGQESIYSIFPIKNNSLSDDAL